jgi:hypothetical protein
MDAFFAFLQGHGLTAAALAAAWGFIKYYVGNDIKTTKAGVAESKEAHRVLTLELEKLRQDNILKFIQLESEIRMNKQEHIAALALIQSSLLTITQTLQDHTEREHEYQDKVDRFMGYAYRKLGNGIQPE